VDDPFSLVERDKRLWGATQGVLRGTPPAYSVLLYHGRSHQRPVELSAAVALPSEAGILHTTNTFMVSMIVLHV